jgi:hypothetical protein
MSSSPSPLPPQWNFVPLAYTLATFLSVFALGTLRLDPHGMVNLITGLGVAGLLAGVAALSVARGWWQRAQAWSARRGMRLPLLLLSIGLGALTVGRFVAWIKLGGNFYGVTGTLWVGAWLALLGALWPAAPARPLLWIRAHRYEVLGVLGATLVGAALRFYALGGLPDVINGDEGLIGTWAQDTGVASGSLTSPFAAMDGVGSMYLRVMKGVIWLLGPTPLAIRLLPAIAGTLAIPALYVLGRHLLGVRAAVVATGLLVVAHAHVHFSRQVAVSYIYATLFVPLALYFLLTAFERRSPLRAALSVLMVGLHINAYVDGWVWLVLLGIVLLAWLLIDPAIYRGNQLTLGIFALAVAVIISPMIAWGIFYPAEFGSRLSMDGTFASGWLANEVKATGRSEASIMLSLLDTALGTFYRLPFDDFYGIRVPTLDSLSRVLWGVGLLLALVRTWDRRMVMLNGWFWGGVVALALMTVPTTTYHYRLLVVLPAACLLVGLATDWLLGNIARITTFQPSHWRLINNGALAALLLVMAVLNLRTYYGDFAGSCVYVGERGRQASMLGSYLATLPPTTRAFVLPTEESFRHGPHLSLDYLSNRMAIANIEPPLAGATPPPELGAPGVRHAVAAVPARRGELAQLARWFPGGHTTTLTNCGAELSVYTW